MNTEEVEEALRVLEYCLQRVKWRLRTAAKRRLETDMLALCTRMRPVVMVDYGGKMPELQERLCMLVRLVQKESPVFIHIRVMVIEDMVYMVHIIELSEHASSQPAVDLLFVDLEQDPPKILVQTEQNSLVQELITIQKQFSSNFSLHEVNESAFPVLSSSSLEAKTDSSQCGTTNASYDGGHAIVESSDLVDLSSYLKDVNVTIPTFNGWLLGYPVVYLVGKDHIADAVYNLSTQPLHLYKIVVCRKSISGKKPCEEELTSFSVPCDLSLEGEEEPWAKSFLAHMLVKFERCMHAWEYLRLEVDACYPQAMAL